MSTPFGSPVPAYMRGPVAFTCAARSTCQPKYGAGALGAPKAGLMITLFGKMEAAMAYTADQAVAPFVLRKKPALSL